MSIMKATSVILMMVGIWRWTEAVSPDCVISALSWGLDDTETNNGYITVSGKNNGSKQTNRRGFNFVELVIENCSISQVRNFDTSESDHASQEMAMYLKGLPKSTVLIGVTADEASKRLMTTGVKALMDIGVDVTGLRRHGKVAFVAHFGRRELTVMQMGPQYGDNVKMVTTSTIPDCDITALSWGLHDTKTRNGYITVSGDTTSTKTTNEKGFNLVELDVSNCTITDVRNFNTSESKDGAQFLSKYIQRLPRSAVLIGVTADEASRQLMTTAMFALEDIGVVVTGLQRHGKLAFVAHVGRRELTVTQMGPEYGVNVKMVTTISMRDCVITALSWGLDDTKTNNGYITVSGETTSTISTNEKGFNLVELDVGNCSMSHVRNFNTSRSINASRDLANYLNDLPTSTVLIGTTADEASYRLENNAKSAFLDLGVDVAELKYHGKVAFVAHVGRRELTVMQLGLRYGDNVKMVTATRVRGCEITALSWGLDDTTQNGYITVNGETTSTKTTNERGFNLVELNVSDCSISEVRNFDTSESTKDSQKLVKYLSSLPKSTVLIGVTAADASYSLRRNAKSALLGLGVDVTGLQYHGKVAFVAYVGRRELTVMQMGSRYGDNVKLVTAAKMQRNLNNDYARCLSNNGGCDPNAHCVSGRMVNCTCKDGFSGNGTVCSDTDECLSAENPCHNNGTCTNVDGAFYCTCLTGYEGRLCDRDTDECLSAENPCHNNGTCTNVEGSFYCTCLTGYKGSQCDEETDECLSAENPCHNNGTCTNVEGSFYCTCLTGYKGSLCDEDTDECLSAENPCHKNGTCTNVDGAFYCTCLTGYEGSLCDEDTDECLSAENPCHNNGTCTNVEGSFYCTCLTGYKGSLCDEDTDECLSAENPCHKNGTCTNVDGAFYCTCLTGYEGSLCDEDTDECLSAENPCHNHGTCTNVEGSFYCTCLTGYKGSLCDEDTDECLSAENPCHNNGTCTNVEGSFYCTCLTGYKGSLCDEYTDECLSAENPCHNNGTCTNVEGSFYCTCLTGYKGSLCDEDTDECLSAENPCHNNGTCTNVEGSFYCTCLTGYKGSLCDEYTDECLSAENPCHKNGTCTNVDGAFYCTCLTGYEGSLCDEDTDECLSAENPCHNNGTCTNVEGSFYCTCLTGYKGSLCDEDTDECLSAENPCHNNGTCTNVEGSFYCTCLTGYKGSLCDEDTDECLSAENPCHKNGTCTNVDGAFYCTCLTGYEGSLCDEDTDECLSAENPCHNNGTCTNVEGSFYCTCLTGYKGSLCDEDTDECLSAENPCHKNGTCTNVDGAFYCTCLTGYEGSLCDEDTDECLSAENPCHNNGTCTNVEGSFYCTCLTGYKGSLCDEDTDECLSAENPCHNNGTCTNVEGSFYCTCLTGYEGSLCDEDINECHDDNTGYSNDVCDKNIYDENVLCTNTFGGFMCANCNQGYTGDGYKCKDVNECHDDNKGYSNDVCDKNIYDENVLCTNTFGGFVCANCNQGYTGDGHNCKATLPRDCADIRALGNTTSGVYTVYIGKSQRTLDVYCDMTTDSVGWTVFQRRQDGSVNFYLNWADYQTGFGNISGEFWLGNDNLHLITSSKRYKLRVELTNFDGSTAFAEYDNFMVASAADKYRLLSVGSYNPIGVYSGNALSRQVGEQFTTKDQDNDGRQNAKYPREDNCAVEAKGAWWYSNCGYCNLNGIYYKKLTNSWDSIYWKINTSLKRTEMKLTPYVRSLTRCNKPQQPALLH